ncbi:MAG: type II toxin-antitoxin system HicB family antitoxin [Erysipelotrichaceae bacterium]|nr:type II toxin-antitoxin system HicB family antitoxin [Erysipelotrichaceae bacterium]
MDKLTYLGIVEKTKTGYSLFFPDFPGCVTVGKTFDEVLKNAQEALSLHHYGMTEDGEIIPGPSDITNLAKEDIEGNIICPVTIYPDRYKKEYKNRRVKTNCTIPLWLKNAGEAAGLNFSRLLEKAIEEELQI